jgi:phosphate butyryltransferase
MLKDYQAIIEKALAKGRRRFAVAGAHGREVIEACVRAGRMGIMEPILIGPAQTIRSFAADGCLEIGGLRIIDMAEDGAIAEKAAELVHLNEADAVMKGSISTPVVLKAVLDKRFGLRMGDLFSHIALMEIPAYHKLILITDSGMVIRPTLEQKTHILQNAIRLIGKLGVDAPKVAVLAAIEKPNPEMPETVDALQLVEMAKNGVFGHAVVEGPMALDMAFSAESARIKNFESRVAGDPDILLMPDIASGNIFAKGLVYLANAKISGIVVGARMPIVLISRAEKAETWIRSIALANVVS